MEGRWSMVRKRKRMIWIVGAAGGTVAIGAMEYLSAMWAFPLAVIPFATSIVLVMGTPDAKPAQPRALIGGHLISALVGLMVVKVTGPHGWAAALAVGLAMVAMHETDTFHPPAGINPLLIVLNDLSWRFLVMPVGVGAVLLALFAFAWHRLLHPAPWPQHWWRPPAD